MKKLILSFLILCSIMIYSQGTIPIPQIIGLPAALASKVDKVTGKSLVADTLAAKIHPHVTNTSNPHATTKMQIGLGNADNTSDASKPISTATQAALDGKQPAGTYATGTGSASGTNTGDETLTSIKTKLGAATTTTDGYLKYQDFVTFNNKQPAGSYLTSFTETDPTIYSWAKAATKPSYSYSEITSKPTALSSFTNDLGNYGGWITGINSGMVTTALGYTPLPTRTFGSAANNNTGDFYAAGSTVANSTAWGSNQFVGAENNTAPSYLMGAYSGGTAHYSTSTAIKSFLGLGSSAYTNTNDHILNQLGYAQSSNSWISGEQYAFRFGFKGTSGHSYIYFPDTGSHSGSMNFQAGSGSALAGGSLTLFGQSHDTKAGSVNVGLTATNSKLSVTNNAFGGGTEVASIDRVGASVFSTCNIYSTVQSTAPTTGALVVAGGMGVGGVSNSGGIRISGNQIISNGEGLEAYYNPANKTSYILSYHRGIDNLFHPLEIHGSYIKMNVGNLGVNYDIDQGYKLAVNGTGLFSGKLRVTNTTDATIDPTPDGSIVTAGGIAATKQIQAGGEIFSKGNIIADGDMYATEGNFNTVHASAIINDTGTSSQLLVADGSLINISAVGSGVIQAQTTVNGSTSGTIVCAMPFQTGSYKKVLIRLNSLNGNATYTFPSSFSFIPDASIRASNSHGISALSATAISITGTSSTGWCIIEGY